ncbi:MAG: hypothetical protein LBH36_01290 [Candidatus Nomurabacteria bacterium]|jgi:hypothetical protein|nr:hypothetical protein [Candidatus Nomurabacteria bacterium]
MSKFITTVANSIKATAVIGVNAGYGHANEAGLDLVGLGELYKSVADSVTESADIYVGAVISPCKVLYKDEWRCPYGGEDAVRIESDCNPSYSDRPAAEYIEAWKAAFIANIQALMEKLDQTTVTVAFSDGDVVYIQRSAEE